MSSLSKKQLPKTKGSKTATPRRWYCPSCAEKQFMESAQCQICDTPRPAVILDAATVLQRKKERMSEQWKCIKCDDKGKEATNFGRKKKCCTCKALRPTTEQLQQYEAAKQRRLEEQQARIEIEKREAEMKIKEQARNRQEFVKWERAHWETLRLLFIGVRDRSSIIALLPMHIIQILIQYLIHVPASPGNGIISFLQQFYAGYIRVKTSRFYHDYYADRESGWCLKLDPMNKLKPIKFSLFKWEEQDTEDRLTDSINLTKAQFLCWWSTVSDALLNVAEKNEIFEKCALATQARIAPHGLGKSVIHPTSFYGHL